MKKIIARLLGYMTLLICGCSLWHINNKNKLIKKDADKYYDMFALTAQWVRNKQKGCNIFSWLYQKGYYRICVYGVGYLGQLLCDDLSSSDVEVVYAIDKDSTISLSNSNRDIKIYKDVDKTQKVDVIIVTAIRDYVDIKKRIESMVDCPVVSLEQVIYECNGI